MYRVRGDKMASPYFSKTNQISTQTPQQMGVQNNILGQIPGLLNRSTQGVDFNPIEERARSQFQTQTVPGLAERFTSLGGGQRSSAFQGALGSAGSDLESGLAALRSQFGLQQQGQQNSLLSSLLGFGFQPSFQNQQEETGTGAGINFLMQILRSIFGGKK
jgi:hypothetical protein